ncbi:transcription factor HES-5-like isoform 1-T5 [Spinachia spinachia]
MAPSSRDCARDRHKMRKPAVEKMRRDRINSCIEQLKVLLEEEFHQRDPDNKLEKADVLEMTVGFLQRHLRPRAEDTAAYGDGYSRCSEGTRSFLSAVTSPPPRDRYAHDAPHSTHGYVPAKPPSPGTDRAVWRPW